MASRASSSIGYNSPRPWAGRLRKEPGPLRVDERPDLREVLFYRKLYPELPVRQRRQPPKLRTRARTRARARIHARFRISGTEGEVDLFYSSVEPIRNVPLLLRQGTFAASASRTAAITGPATTAACPINPTGPHENHHSPASTNATAPAAPKTSCRAPVFRSGRPLGRLSSPGCPQERHRDRPRLPGSFSPEPQAPGDPGAPPGGPRRNPRAPTTTAGTQIVADKKTSAPATTAANRPATSHAGHHDAFIPTRTRHSAPRYP